MENVIDNWDEEATGDAIRTLGQAQSLLLGLLASNPEFSSHYLRGKVLTAQEILSDTCTVILAAQTAWVEAFMLEPWPGEETQTNK